MEKGEVANGHNENKSNNQGSEFTLYWIAFRADTKSYPVYPVT